MWKGKEMTNLTEKWKNGELINEEDAGCYYIETIDGEIYPDCLSPIDGFKNTYNYAVKKILAPVPSYAEYMILVSYKEELTKACKMRDKIIKKYQDIDTWWKVENTKIKELLKECRKALNKAKGDTVWYPVEIDHVLTQIDEILE